MADNYGPDAPEPTRVADCGWDLSVNFNGRPLPAQDINVQGNIPSDKVRSGLALNHPSGFLQTNPVKQVADSQVALAGALNNALSGEVLTSEHLENSFYLASKGDNFAVVNGWVINVSATEEDLTNHNLIRRTPASGVGPQGDLVFLEVWRSLVKGSDPYIQKYGNQGTTQKFANDLMIDGMGMETSQRVQIKYRVRVAPSYADLSQSPDGFEESIKARGSSNTDSTRSFTSMASLGDPGLYRAGTGSDLDRQVFDSVDGYVYAIPMFWVAQRWEGTFDLNSLNYAEKKNALNSGRPDRLFQDRIYAEDIIDLRRVSTYKGSLESIAQDSLVGIMSGKLTTTRGKVRASTGGLETTSGGSLQIKADVVTSSTSGSVPKMGEPVVGRRALNSARVWQNNNIVKVTWIPPFNTAFLMPKAGLFGFPIVSNIPNDERVILFSAEGVTYTPGVDYATNSFADEFQVLWLSGMGPSDVYLKFDAQLPENNESSFSDVPEKFLEQHYQKGAVLHKNAVYQNPVLLYGRDPLYLDPQDRVECLGVQTGDLSSFGQVAFLHRTAVGTSLNIDLPGFTLPVSGQKVLGVRSIRRKLSSGGWSATYATSVGTVFVLNETSNQIEITGILTAQSGELDELEISLYLETKFSDFSREGSGIRETYESRYIQATSPAAGVFIVNTWNLPEGPKAIAGSFYLLTGDVEGPSRLPYVLKKETPSSNRTSVQTFAFDTKVSQYPLRTRSQSITQRNPTHFSFQQPGLTGTVELGIFLHSWYDSSEDLFCFYNTRGYQGKGLSGSRTVISQAIGKALVSSNGSGSLSYPSFEVNPSQNSVLVHSDRELRVLDIDLSRGQIKPGHYFQRGPSTYEWGGGLYNYSRVVSVTYTGGPSPYTSILCLDTIVSNLIVGDTYTSGENFYFFDFNMLPWSNLLGRVPSGTADEYLYEYDPSERSPILVDVASQGSPVLCSGEEITLGSGDLGLRGAFDILDSEGNPLQLGLSLSVLPGSRILQPLVVKDKLTGFSYLAVVSSVSDDNLGTSPYRGESIVDLFELKGRTVVRGA